MRNVLSKKAISRVFCHILGVYNIASMGTVKIKNPWRWGNKVYKCLRKSHLKSSKNSLDIKASPKAGYRDALSTQ